MIRSRPSLSTFRNLFAALLVAGAGAAGASGLPDPAFGVDGVFLSTLPGNHGPSDGLIDSKGRYVAVGSRVSVVNNGSYVMRINRAGLPDTSFHGTGDVQIVAPAGYEALVLQSVVQQNDGKLVVAGRVGPNFINDTSAVPYICRLLESGDFDPAFGTGGCTLQPYVAAASAETVIEMALQSDGHIVIAGSSVVADVRRPAVLRLNPDGSRDLCFNEATCTAGGSVYNPLAGNTINAIQAVDVQPDGKILLAGSGVGAQSIDMIAVRLLPTGVVDAAFGNAGSRTVGFELGGSNSDNATAIRVLSDGGIIMAGDASDAFSSRWVAVAKLTNSGQMDIFFGQGGTGRSWTFFSDVALNSFGSDVTIQNDGKLVVGGTAYTGLDNTGGQFAAWRLLPNGVTDSSFGYDGRITVSTDAGLENQQVVRAIDADEKYIALFGFRRATNQSSLKTAIVRLEMDAVFADGFETP